jgi:hypothetical protein
LLYQFKVYNGTQWIYSTEYTTDNTCKWTPEKAGEYILYVYVKDSESVEEYDSFGKKSYIVVEKGQPVSEDIIPVTKEEPFIKEVEPKEEIPPTTEETQLESDEVI